MSEPRFDVWVVSAVLNRLFAARKFPSERAAAEELDVDRKVLKALLTGETQRIDPNRIVGLAIELGGSLELAAMLRKFAVQTKDSNASGFQDLFGSGTEVSKVLFPLLEASATSLDIYEESLITGLFQIREYIATLVNTDPASNSSDHIAETSRNREERQRNIFNTRQAPPALRVILNEQSLLRINSEPFYQAQLEYMLKLIEQYQVGIYVLPLAAGLHPANLGSFTLMQFEQPTPLRLGYVPSPAGSLWVEDRTIVTLLQTQYTDTLKLCIDLERYANSVDT